MDPLLDVFFFVLCLQEIVERFTSYKKTQQNLGQLVEKNKGTLLNLEEQKEHLNKQFEDMTYSGEAKHSR